MLHAGQERPLLRTLSETRARHSWPCAHAHHAFLFDQALTAAGERSPFFRGCHSAARSGRVVERSLNPRRTRLPAQKGQPPPRALSTTRLSHSWPQRPSHQTTRPEPARTRSDARPPFFSGCHSAATDGHAAARPLKPGIGSSPLMSLK